MNRFSVISPTCRAWRGARADATRRGPQTANHNGRCPTAGPGSPFATKEARTRAMGGGDGGDTTQEDGSPPLQSSGTARPGIAPPVLPCNGIFLCRFGDPLRIQEEARPGSDSPVLPCRQPPSGTAGAPQSSRRGLTPKNLTEYEDPEDPEDPDDRSRHPKIEVDSILK